MKRYIPFIMAGLSLMGCSNDIDLAEPFGSDQAEECEVYFDLVMPDYSQHSSRANVVDENAICAENTYAMSMLTKTNTTYTVSKIQNFNESTNGFLIYYYGRVDMWDSAEKAWLKIFANIPATTSSASIDKTNLSDALNCEDASDKNHLGYWARFDGPTSVVVDGETQSFIPMYGEVEFNHLEAMYSKVHHIKVKMIRCLAKVTLNMVYTDPALANKQYTLKQIVLPDVYEYGCPDCSNYLSGSEEPHLPQWSSDRIDRSATAEEGDTSLDIFACETDNTTDHPLYLLMECENPDGDSKWYKLSFIDATTEVEVNGLLRNHHYVFNIYNLDYDGEDTQEAAAALASPHNAVGSGTTFTVTDDGILSITTDDGTTFIGVSNTEINMGVNDNVAHFEFVTNDTDPQLDLSGIDASLLSFTMYQSETTTVSTEDGTAVPAYYYSVWIWRDGDLSALVGENNYFIIRAGSISKTITLNITNE